MNIKINKSKVREISELEWGDLFRVCGGNDKDSIYMLLMTHFILMATMNIMLCYYIPKKLCRLIEYIILIIYIQRLNWLTAN